MMKRNSSIILAFGIVILFFIHLAGTLVQSIYIMDLMNTNLDEKVLGLLFFFTPLLVIPFYKKFRRGLVWGTFVVLLLARGMLPYLSTSNQVLVSGLGIFAVLSLLFLLLAAKPKGGARSQIGLWGSAGLALAICLSVLLRTLDYGLDYSLIPAGGWVGWGLGLSLGWLLAQLEIEDPVEKTEKKKESITFAVLGVFLVLTLVWFSFSAPAVIARWTEGNYTLIVMTISLFAVGWVLLSLIRPQLFDRIGPRGLLLWNLLFTLCLTATILAHRVPFPPTPDSAPVVMTSPGWLQQIPLVLMLLLFPVIFLNLRLFLNQIQQAVPAPRDLVPGILLGSTVLILLVFAHIFTNVWGYVKPVSLPFRNMFWLPYLLLSGMITLLVWRAKRIEPDLETVGAFHWGWTVLLGAIFIGSVVRTLPTEKVKVNATDQSSLVVMTFNIQQANDKFAEKSFDRQLALIRKVSPDILSLQETDATRISLNNNDYARYYAEQLGYYSYYGPTTVTGTYGTAILSKYPLLNTRTVFTYSDTDEIGVTEAEVEVGGHLLTIYDVHPDGSDTAKLAFAKALIERSKYKPYVTALGDYNLRDYEEAYKLINSVYTNAWTSVYPSKISSDGVDMSGEDRIDHIFVSSSLGVRNPVYVLSPESATDHPVHWAEIFWKNP
jgi:endonuclease/exonuclease/phosphatase family metal-dependent hydrolase